MKVVIFGASGRTGIPLVEQALAAGHEVTAFVRDLAKLPVRRLVSLTGAGVRDSRDLPPSLIGRFIHFLLKQMAPEVLADGERHVALIRESDREWVIVRGPRLKDGPATGNYKTGYLRPAAGPVARGDVAHFMLTLLTDNKYLRQMPMIIY